MGSVLAGIVLVAALVGLVTKGSAAPSSDNHALRDWFATTGSSASQTTEQIFDELLTGLSRSKVDNGGPGIVMDEAICRAGSLNVRRYAPDLPPSGPLRDEYHDLMRTGAAVFSHCLAGIATSAPAASKHDVDLMVSEMSTYSTVIATYEHALNAAHL